MWYISLSNCLYSTSSWLYLELNTYNISAAFKIRVNFPFRFNCNLSHAHPSNERQNFLANILLSKNLLWVLKRKLSQSLPSSSSNSSPATRGIKTSPDSPSKSSDERCFGDRDFEKWTAIFSESLSASIMRSRQTAVIIQRTL